MCSLRRPKRARSPPGTPGPHTSEVISGDRQRAYPSASPASTSKIRHFRQQLFGMPELRSGTSTMNLDNEQAPPGMNPPLPPPVHITPNSSASDRDRGTDDEQRDASPRRRPPPRRPAAPDLEDALTRLTQTVQQMVTHQQQPQAPAPGTNPPEDPNFNWEALRSPLETPFVMPPTGTVQRIVAGLFAKIQTGGLTGRDLHEAKFAVDMMADWIDMDDELRNRVFQRVNLYAIVAAHGWPTAIAATTVSTNPLVCVLPPGIQPITSQRQRQPQQPAARGGRQRNQQPAAEAPAPAPAPPVAPAPARRGRQRRR